MTTFYKILILCIGFALSNNLKAQIHDSAPSPLTIERNTSGEMYYSIDYSALDFDRADYSDAFEIYMTPVEGRLYEDCTKLFIDGKLKLDSQFFYGDGYSIDAPINGVLGNDFSRIELYTYPDDVVKTDSITFAVRGHTKVKTLVRDFTGEIKIMKIYHIPDSDYLDYYIIIAAYSFREAPAQKDCGEFKGIFGAYGYIDNDTPGKILIDDRNSIADGYMNRTYVGTWQSYLDSTVIIRCILGDYRLPFSFDFDIGDGEMRVNPKYASPEWDELFNPK